VHRLSGKPPSTTPSLYKLIWLRQNRPDTLEQAAMIVDVHGYLAHRLTGNRVTSAASADPMSLVDMRTFQWSEELLAHAGLSLGQLPTIVPPGAVMAEVSTSAAAATGLPVGLPVVAGAGDGQAAGLGAAVLSNDRAYLSLGTSLTLGVHSDQYRTSMSYRTLSSPLAGGYTLEGLVASGALSLSWFRDTIAQLPDNGVANAELERMVRSVPAGSRGLLFLPYLTSAETPYWDASARAAFVGLGDYHARADLARAVCEGLAFEIRLLLDSIEVDTGTSPSRLVAMGGASGATALVQIIADVLQRDIAIAAEPETAALGAAILAAHGVAAGGASELRARADHMTRTRVVYRPSHEAAPVYDELFTVYRTLYPTLRGAFSALAAFRD
jgi:xylulokinase